MNDLLPIIGYIAGLFGLIAVVSAAIIVVRSTAVKATMEAQEGLISTLKEKVELLEKADEDNKKRIADLERELSTVKTIPLDKIVETQIEILNILKDIKGGK